MGFLWGVCPALGIPSETVRIHQLVETTDGKRKPHDVTGQLTGHGSRFKLHYENPNVGTIDSDFRHPDLSRALGLLNQPLVRTMENGLPLYAIPGGLMIDLAADEPQLFVFLQYLNGDRDYEYVYSQRVFPAEFTEEPLSPLTENKRPRWESIHVDVVFREDGKAPLPIRTPGYIFLNTFGPLSFRNPVTHVLVWHRFPLAEEYYRWVGLKVSYGEYLELHSALSVPNPMFVHPLNGKILFADIKGIVINLRPDGTPEPMFEIAFHGEHHATYTVSQTALKGSDGLLWCRDAIAKKSAQVPDANG